MAPTDLQITPLSSVDIPAVVALWHRCGLVRTGNDPQRDIALKLAYQPELFLVGRIAGQPVATAMAGYEGHRGWINYLAVDPDYQRQGLGAQIMREAERLLRAMGCPKINLQVRKNNLDVVIFYEQIGFTEDAVVGFGKRLL